MSPEMVLQGAGIVAACRVCAEQAVVARNNSAVLGFNFYENPFSPGASKPDTHLIVSPDAPVFRNRRLNTRRSFLATVDDLQVAVDAINRYASAFVALYRRIYLELGIEEK